MIRSLDHTMTEHGVERSHLITELRYGPTTTGKTTIKTMGGRTMRTMSGTYTTPYTTTTKTGTMASGGWISSTSTVKVRTDPATPPHGEMVYRDGTRSGHVETHEPPKEAPARKWWKRGKK